MELQSILIPPEADGFRADTVLIRYFPELPEFVIRDAFSRKDVKLDGIRILRDTRVSAGQMLQIYYPSDQAVLPLRIVWEDDNVLLVNKQAGISVERDRRGGLSLTDLCARHVLENNAEAFLPVPCHRLDNKTSGLCLFAKNENAIQILTDVFRNRKLDKYYECLVRGVMKPPEAVCKAWLLKDAAHAKVTVADHELPGSKRIITAYSTISSGPVSRLSVHLITGRTHQIRAHLAAMGHPILGDDVYGDREFNKANNCRSLRLCAVSLKLDTSGRLPDLDGRLFTVSAPF